MHFAADVVADVAAVVAATMASTDLSLLDLTDKETREKLSLWDRRTDPMAPLTERQMDSVLDIRTAAETLPVPSEVRCHTTEASWLRGLLMYFLNQSEIK